MRRTHLWIAGVITAAALCFLSGPTLGADSVVRSRVGGSAVLGCSLSPPATDNTTPRLFPLHVVEWVRLGYAVPVLIKFGVYSPRVHPNYRGRVSLERGASLRIDGLQLDDEGWFECRILLLDRQTDEFQNGTWTFLSITAPPVFFKTPPPILEVLEGEPLILTCGAHGNPPPIITWRKDDTLIENGDNAQVTNGSLSLFSVSRDKAGIYKCHVSNEEGNLTHSSQLLVKGPPVIVIPPEDTTLNMSQDAVLRCQAEAYPSNLTYLWWKQGENVFHIDLLKTRVKVLVDGTLLIQSVTPDDAGNYTCVPTNGLLTPPTASAYLTVKHPAQVLPMPEETYLPVGMEGVITCPVRAEPPMLFVNWTKDGHLLNLDMFPGWMVNSEGSVFITAANDDAVGMYTCTAYNSYGTMGQSSPTKVVLQDPPSFRVTPRAEYLQEVGRDLVIPCEAHGDPSPNITWSKVGSAPRSPFRTAQNGSLIMRPLSKDHQGTWECSARNRVAAVSTRTAVSVLGTSPHAVSAVTLVPGTNRMNVSWEPGFDGGYSQKFTVWVKQVSRGKHEWTSLPVPPSQSYLLVTGLLPGTGYQFSILPQNKLGSGPFSEIITASTLVPKTKPPPTVKSPPLLTPPRSLSANQSSKGVVLQWLPPLAESTTVTGFILQSRREKGEWVVLEGFIEANQSEILVQGLLKDCNYELRMLSRDGQMISEPSESVNISTAGMDMYPARTRLSELLPEPLVAGVIGGVCFLCVAIILSLVTACAMNRRRERRRRKRREDIPIAFQKGQSPQAGSLADSPDSVLKLKLCPLLFSHSSSSSDHSSFEKASRSEYQDQRTQLLSNAAPPPRYTLFESHIGGLSSPTAALESISRGPDGRFIVQPYEETSATFQVKKSLRKDFPQCIGVPGPGGSPKSNSLCSEMDEKKELTLTVNIPRSRSPNSSPGRVKLMAKNFSKSGCFYTDEEGEELCSEVDGEMQGEHSSFYSDNLEKRSRDSLKKYRMCIRTAQSQSREEILNLETVKKDKKAEKERYKLSSYLPIDRERQVSQMEHEKGIDSLSKCLKLAKEREEIERELKQYTVSHRVQEREGRSDSRAVNQSSLRAGGRDTEWETKDGETEPVWKPQEVTFRPKSKLAMGQSHKDSGFRRGCYFGNTSSPLGQISSPSSFIHWDISPVTSVTSLVPAQSPAENTTPTPMTPMNRTAVRDSGASAGFECTGSPVTECTSLSLLSPTSDTFPHISMDVREAKSRYPERLERGDKEAEVKRCQSQSLLEEDWKHQQHDALAEETILAKGARESTRDLEGLTFTSSPTLISKAEREEQIEHYSCILGIDLETETERETYPDAFTRSPEATLRCPSEKGESEEDDGKPESLFTGCTLPYEHGRKRDMARENTNDKRETKETSDEPPNNTTLLSPDFEKEGIRARSRKSDKYLFSDSPSNASAIPLIENDTNSDHSDLSVSKMSGFLKPTLKPPSSPTALCNSQKSRASPLQTSAILEYLSLPGFIEMSVDEPGEVTEITDLLETSADWKHGDFLKAEPNLDPKDSEPHVQKSTETDTSQKCTGILEDTFVDNHSSHGNVDPCETQKTECFSTELETRKSTSKAATSGEYWTASERSLEDTFEHSPRSEYEVKQTHHKNARPHCDQNVEYSLNEKTDFDLEAGRILSPNATHESLTKKDSTATKSNMQANVIAEQQEHVLEQQRHDFTQKSQVSRTNNIVSRFCQTPTPFLKKSMSSGLNRTVPQAEKSSTFLKKSVSLGSQKWESYESPCPRNYVSERCLRDELPAPDIRIKSYSLGRAPAPFSSRRGVFLKGPPAFRPQNKASWETLRTTETALPHRPRYLPPGMDLQRHKQSSERQSSELQRQAVTFPEMSRWPSDYQHVPGPVQPKSSLSESFRVAQVIPPGPGMARGDFLQPLDSRRGSARAFLPRGYSWPSPYHVSIEPKGKTAREHEGEGETDTEMKDFRDVKEARASYASQSSGRGSVGPSSLLRQSLSLTPSLPGSPETTEESERQGAELERTMLELQEKRPTKRRNTSVDESYEWDTGDFCIESEILEALRLYSTVEGGSRERDRRRERPRSTIALRELQNKGLLSSVSPSDSQSRMPCGSLSEERFNALRREFQEFRQAQEAAQHDPAPPDTDTALL
uniref:Immunoglobulin superfamily, member 9a n=1 Tax=Lepisosteus oculatus TaxID=7918 RepID=W5NGS0_LEPOC|nr:PREDICTED: protein turtle homolog A-like isoform X1 [Lepisosteus oculatus]